MKSKIITLPFPPESIAQDIMSRIGASEKSVKDVWGNISYWMFWQRFLPDTCEPEKANKGAEKKRAKTDWQTIFRYALPHLNMFYRPDYKCGTNRRFPKTCKYNVIIPYRQQSMNFFSYHIISANDEFGDSIVSVRNVYHNHLAGPLLSAVSPVVASNQKEVYVNTDTIHAMLANYKEHREQIAKELGSSQGLCWGMLKEEPSLRLPCYNIPLQCVYELALAEMGRVNDFVHRGRDQHVKGKQRKTYLEVTPIDWRKFYAALSWSFWEKCNFQEEERTDHLKGLLALIGKDIGFNNEQVSLRIMCRRMFEKQLGSGKGNK